MTIATLCGVLSTNMTHEFEQSRTQGVYVESCAIETEAAAVEPKNLGTSLLSAI